MEKFKICLALSLFVMSCAQKPTVTTAQEGTPSRKVAFHVEDSDKLLNIGVGVKLKLKVNLNIKPNSSSYDLQVDPTGRYMAVLRLAIPNLNVDRELKAGEIFEIENIETREGAGGPIYDITFQTNNKFTQLRIYTPSKDYLLVGQFEALLAKYFEVIQPPPVQM
ncbi:MAG: hypothetical protein V4654_05920 [Bdellovibrionota bacterium]